MIPVYQDKFAPHDDDPEATGNCMQAAIASLLELNLEDVPHFAVEKDEIEGADHRGAQAWWRSIERFAASYGFRMIVAYEEPLQALGIMSGQSPRGNWEHVVVSDGWAMIHDPHPDNTGVIEPDEWWYFVPIDPAVHKKTQWSMT